MANVVRLRVGQRQPARPHYIKQWAEMRGYDKPVRLAEALGADKGHVSKWYRGTSPGIEWQIKMAALFNIEPADLFSNPDDVWFSQFIRGRDPQEVTRIKQGLEVNFPRKPR
jgi:transcriptional regulator with XRE-family HTH domain